MVRRQKHFLHTAEIVSIKSFKTKAVTRPMKVELSDGEQTHYALFKTIDDFEPLKHFGRRGKRAPIHGLLRVRDRRL